LLIASDCDVVIRARVAPPVLGEISVRFPGPYGPG
jgi:hypothetical protein